MVKDVGTYFSDSHLGSPADAAKRDERRDEATVHLVEEDVRALDIDSGLMGLIQLVYVEELVESAGNDLTSRLVEDNSTALSVKR